MTYLKKSIETEGPSTNNSRHAERILPGKRTSLPHSLVVNEQYQAGWNANQN